jgi:lipoprotein NlpD
MKKNLIWIIAVTALLGACTTARGPAPVVERPTPAKTGDASRPTPAANPQQATPQAPPKPADGRGFYTVKRGDTLIQIALEFGQNYRDLVAWNNLANPNDIKVDQVLRVLPPDAPSATASAPQPGGTPPVSGIETRPLGTPPAAPVHKTGPRGEKRPFADGTIAEMQKADVPPVATAPPKAEPPRATESRPPEKQPEPGPDDEGIAWVWPAEGRIIASFSDGRKGIDIAGKMGQPVLAAGSGKVLYAGSGIRGYGNLVIVKHSNNLLSAYAHNRAIFVKEDQTVSKGQKIAEMGNSDSDVVKLHFEIRQQGKPVDPTKFLPNR